MNDEQIIALARIKLPLFIKALNRANTELKSANPDLDEVKSYLHDKAILGFYDITDLLDARDTIDRLLGEQS